MTAEKQNIKRTDNGSTFADLLAKYNTLATIGTNSDEYADVLQSLAVACTASVLKKCYDVSGSKVMLSLRRDVAHFASNVANVTELNRMNASEIYETTYNKDGDEIRTVSSEYERRITNAVKSTYGEGADLVQVAVEAILRETQAQREREPQNSIDIERAYTVRRIKSKVWIKDTDTVGGWETVKTSPVKEIYRAVRRAISNSASVQVANNVYTYYEDVARDDESGAEERIYRRADKYADIGTETVYGYTADEFTIESISKIRTRLELTDRQDVVLTLRQKGYGYKAIATRLGVSQRAIAKIVEQIRKKANGIGFNPETYTKA